MATPFDPRAWPIALRVPLAVAALMVLVGIVLSERVLARLADLQEGQLREVARSYLDGLSSAVVPAVVRDDPWEAFDAIERLEALNKGLRPIETVVTDGGGRVVAASDPRRHAVGALYAPPASVPTGAAADFSLEADAESARAVRPLAYPGRTVGTIYAIFDTSHVAAERRDVLATLVATNVALTFALAAAGWFLVRRMMRPVAVLTEHLGAARDGRPTAIDPAVVERERGDFRRLFAIHNDLVQSIADREELAKRLAEEERLGSLGRLASTLAHEINNPLGGILNALDTLRRHGHVAQVRKTSIGLVERGLLGIRDVVQTTLALYRADAAPRDLRSADIDDLRLLAAAEARRRRVFIDGVTDIPPVVGIAGTPVRQAILNLLLNAIAVSPPEARVVLDVRRDGGELRVAVRDRGPGLSAEHARRLVRGGDVPLGSGGLGLWTTNRLVRDLGGRIEVGRPDGGGSSVVLRLPLKPSGELSDVA
ncbi:sensor histidine kinase [Propylenella binzhouense]|uniref:histidine kinase n=1 Tax=Propylenella binzhouense TaxID=2555902 RepID=A0A964WV94_9HYPH|nr:HAMP domain-containing sensor histidine kinase [Propylenella binzhouense]MYZ49987.1 HAMP domain-containing histidine kinase [Propylenella binzhouense]